jgi:fatty acid desaturase
MTVQSNYGTGVLVALGWMLAAMGAGAYAARLNRTAYWGFVALVISPLPVFLLLFWLGSRKGEDDRWFSCPFCADAVTPGARRCQHCHSDLAPGDLTPTDAEMC